MKYYYLFIIQMAFILPANAYEFSHFALKEGVVGFRASSSKALDNSILQELAEYMLKNHQQIGSEQVHDLIENHDHGGGVKNFSGFTWYKPMLNYNISAERNISPDPFEERWIVQDSFTISIEAATLIKNLQDAEILSITPDQLEAFVGLSFQRTYYHYHFAATYLKGLTADYSKLFLSFLNYRPEKLFNLEDDEVIKRRDIFTFNAGGKVEAPLGNGLELRSGVLISHAFKNTVSLHKLRPEELADGRVLKLGVERELNKKAQAQLSLQYDFFNLLKITLLSSELEYTYGKTKKTYLTLLDTDKDVISNNSLAKQELVEHLKGKQNINFWLSRLSSLESRVKENLSTRYSFLLFGALKKRATEQVVIIKSGIKKTFYKHYSQTKKYIQGFLSRIFSRVINKIFKFDWGIKEKAYSQQDFYIEYEKEEKLNDMQVTEHSKFSVKISKSFYVDKTQGRGNRRLQKFITKKLKDWSLNSDKIIQKVESQELIGPIALSFELNLNENSFKQIDLLSTEQMTRYHFYVCGIPIKHLDHFLDERKRIRFFRSYLTRSSRCGKRLFKKFEKYKQASQQIIALDKLKNYFESLLKEVKNVHQLYPLLGQENLFIHGSISAQTPSDNRNFLHFFKSGQFNGLGVIDRFKQGEINVSIATNE